MKTAIYIEDGVVQLVLTPDTEHEKSCLEVIRDKKVSAKIFDGAFYDCRGGWIRQMEHYPKYDHYGTATGPQSLIIRVNETP